MGAIENAHQAPEVVVAESALEQARTALDSFEKTAPSPAAERSRTMSEYGIFALCLPAIGAMAMASHIAPVTGPIVAMSLIIVAPAAAMIGVSYLGKSRAREVQERNDEQREKLHTEIATREKTRDLALQAATLRLFQEAQAQQQAAADQPPAGAVEHTPQAVKIDGVRVDKRQEQGSGPQTSL